MSERGPAAATFDFAGAYAAIDALYQERGWTDGLPIVPPTEAAVREFLGFADREPREVVGVLPPRQGEATVERIAVNAVMAGCRPEYFPVLLAAIEALADPAFNLDSIQATTHPVAPLLVVNGPIAREIGLNAGYNAFGQGARANVTIGRAVRLVLMNVGGGLPGTGDRATQGSPAKLAYCVAENEAESPWEPLHVEAGLAPDVSTVTAFGCEGPHNIQDHYSATGEGVLRTVAGAMGQAGSNNLLAAGWPLLALGPEHAATIARDGFTKRQVKEFLFEHARFPLARLGPEYRRYQVERRDAADAPDTMLPIVRAPEDLGVIVVGGAGKHSSWQPSFGDGTRPTRRTITRRRRS
ncbi:MAG: hypothetical protein A2050_08755 [Candidatus Rokubacteria bacterium GWA2_73_35]|nr:MAG: hypothetical protein A2050_08755 [Candidatus Rokubacteria bacterium GWA2_73_35]